MRLLAIFLTATALGSCGAPESQGAAPVEVNASAAEVRQYNDSALYYLQKIDSATLPVERFHRAAAAMIAADSLVKSDPEHLMKAGLLCLGDDEFRFYGVNYLVLLSNKYPAHPYGAHALMQLSLFYDNALNDGEKSAAYLRTLVERYPNSALAADARLLLQEVGTTGESERETVQQWLNNSK